MSRVLVLSIVSIVLVALLAVGCAQRVAPPAPTGPALPADITGNISDVQPGANSALGSIRIEGEKIAGNAYDKAVVRITSDTRIWEKTADGYVPATFADLQFGATVTAAFSGPVMESYPVQATAAEVTLLYRMPKN
jgi:hypothetical protein